MTYPGEVDHASGRLLYRGAEADVLKGSWVGREAVFKVRKPLAYRHPVLDESIRRQRTVHEAEAIAAARKAGVSTPHVLLVDLGRSTLVLEFVAGERLKDLLGRAKPSESKRHFGELGRVVARLHAAGIMHGDLTTANIMVTRAGLCLLDFGLSIRSSRLEDCAVDLRLIKETLTGAHSAIAAAAFEELRNGYAGVAGTARAKRVFAQLSNVERRGRYARVV